MERERERARERERKRESSTRMREREREDPGMTSDRWKESIPRISLLISSEAITSYYVLSVIAARRTRAADLNLSPNAY